MWLESRVVIGSEAENARMTLRANDVRVQRSLSVKLATFYDFVVARMAERSIGDFGSIN